MWPSRAVGHAFSNMEHRALGSSWALVCDSSCRLCGWLLKSQWSRGEGRATGVDSVDSAHCECCPQASGPCH